MKITQAVNLINKRLGRVRKSDPVPTGGITPLLLMLFALLFYSFFFSLSCHPLLYLLVHPRTMKQRAASQADGLGEKSEGRKEKREETKEDEEEEEEILYGAIVKLMVMREPYGSRSLKTTGRQGRASD